ncbi:MAG: phage major capsid protein [Alphaproteobacteria bacterium]
MEFIQVTHAVDALASAFETFKAANDEALRQKADRGASDPLTSAKLVRIEDDIDRLKSALDRTQATLNRPARAEAPGGDADGAVHAKAFGRYLRKGDEAQLATLQAKALSVGNDPEGGYLVTPAMSQMIARTVFESSPVRALAVVETISGDSLEMLVDKDEPGAGWVAETATRAETDTPDLAKVAIPAHEMYAEPRATQKLIDDASLDVEAWLAGKIAERFARLEATAFVAGDGVGRPRGLLTYPAGTAWSQIEQINSGSNGQVTGDGLIDAQGALKEGYGGNAAWLMNRVTMSQVRKLKDSQGMYLWQPGLQPGRTDTLLGRSVHVAADMPVPATGALAVLLGDLRRAYQIVDRVGVRILRDPFTAKPYVKFYATKRVGGDVVNFEAVKILKLSA